MIVSKRGIIFPKNKIIIIQYCSYIHILTYNYIYICIYIYMICDLYVSVYGYISIIILYYPLKTFKTNSFFHSNNFKPTCSLLKTDHLDPSQVLKIADSERATLLEQLSRSCNELAEGRQGRGCWEQAMTRQLIQVMVIKGYSYSKT